MPDECYIAPAVLERWVIVKAKDHALAWSGSRWVRHHQGLGTCSVQVSNFPSRMEASRAANAAGFTVRIEGYYADQLSITCYRCGMTSYSLNDVWHKYCGRCCRFHEEKR